MNRKQLEKLGVPPACVPAAIRCLSTAAEKGTGFGLKGKRSKEAITAALADPAALATDPVWADLATSLVEYRAERSAEPDKVPIDYAVWECSTPDDTIDPAAHAQMRQACAVPSAIGAALMPDAHVGYGLPIGGVLACENAVIPYAVGVDIACRMKLSVLDMPIEAINSRRNAFREALDKGTRFGVGVEHTPRQQHDVMDQDWSVTRVTREKKDKAWKQLGTSGSGNHFVEFGELVVDERSEDLGLDAGRYVALLSHSGSRGAGAAVCSTYSQIAQRLLSKRYAALGRLAWLSLDSEEGQAYWAAMNLMGDYAAANHAVIHRLVTKLLGAHVIAGVENHHNFAWKERHDPDGRGEREVIVHRKGATPAAAGELGVIPGSMGTPAFVVRGRGVAASLASASHGAGRRMSRRQANDTFRFGAEQKRLAEAGVEVLAAGADEVPGVYKDIHAVMAAQQDLVDTLARFEPRVVRMCGDGSRAED
ncbi:RNA-splicing ligase RtcB [Botrimarina colliarenosi]|uniref:3'-phosphate/5'-hydroxy nucleic acid ligase n=1 Tax=Botrimarina colliarenosi TaxID=2528001 RepID=A0A5C6AIC8_9BACT|nr:RtcB family protein [Botrimarina colliarenosi]TWT99170.1 RNA-splicing ligase RtcB [Botrimarina colliarenosi]